VAEKHDKTEAPTAKRKRDARKKGQIARSQELVIWAQMFAVVVLLPATLVRTASAFRDLTARMGHLIELPDQDKALSLFSSGLLQVMLGTMPLAVALAGVGLVGHLVQVGLPVGMHGLKPKMERINPFKGFKRLFSKQAGWESAKVLTRTTILTGVAMPPVQDIGPRIAAMGDPGLDEILGVVAQTAATMLRNTALAGMLLAVVDYAFQKRRVMGMLRMSKQDVKDENRLSEGDPHLKAAIRGKQMEMSRNRMMSEVATASAVIVNPTHVAVAIRYVPGGPAPVVVAKGRGAIALRIREEAERNGVPIMRDIPLARALHGACALGQEIPVELYEAVARVLAVVMALRPAV
jgi:flagellar biosynthetic protein FlhB